jgi:hypothetical protein
MLQPAYFVDLFAKNRAKDNKNLYAPIAKIPSYLKQRDGLKNFGRDLSTIKK